MAKQTGLNSRLYVEGNDLSGDANGFSISETLENYDVTTLDSPAVKRITGRTDATVGVNAFFDAASTHISAVATANSGTLPEVDQEVLIPFGSSIGSACAGFVAKQSDYTTSGATGSPLTVSVNYTINAVSPMMGKMLTAHDDTFSSASSNDSLDNTSSTASGGSAMLQVFSLGSGTVDVKIEDSANDSTWADLVSFTSASGSTSERVIISGTIRRYVRVTTSGTFTDAKIACAIVRD